MALATSRSRFVDEAVVAYSCDHTSPPDQVQRDLQEVTRERTGAAAGMQIGDDQAVFMEILARSMGARRGLEVGTFTGYSALALARGMGPEGRLLCCDVSEEWTNIAREYWERAGVSDRIELQDRPSPPDASGSPRIRGVRHRVPGRRQGHLPRLLRGDHPEAARRWIAAGRQHPPIRPRARSRSRRRLDQGRSGS